VVNATPRPLYPRQRDPLPIIQETGWTPESEWTGTENLSRTEIRSLDRPARSESLYGLRCPDSHLIPRSNKTGRCIDTEVQISGRMGEVVVVSASEALKYDRHVHLSLRCLRQCLAQNGHKNFHRLGLCQLINIMTDCQ
jgi:hypothetical protein